MMSALSISKTGLAAQDTALRTISNNLANVSTVGFKRDVAVFQDLLYQIQAQPGGSSSQDTQLPSGLQLGSGVRIAGTHKIFTEGSLQNTGNSTDMAIIGRGFFQISMPDGSVAYTRNGQFQLNENGEMVTSQGYTMEPAITIPAGTSSISIGIDGTVTAQSGTDTASTQVGNVQLVDFVNPAGLQAKGDNLFQETSASGAAQAGTAGQNGLGKIQSQVLENSNVSVVEELVNMVSTQRAYEMNSRVVSTADQMLQYIAQNI